MQHLIAKRNRLRDLIAEQEANPWLIYSDVLMHDMLTDENYALMLLEAEQHLSLRQAAFKQMDSDKLKILVGMVNAYDLAIGNLKNDTKYAVRKLAHIVEGRPKALRSGVDHAATVRSRFEGAQYQWDQLTDQARAWMNGPLINPETALDFPDPDRTIMGQERAVFYPERTAKQEAQLRKLREALAWVEKQLADDPQP